MKKKEHRDRKGTKEEEAKAAGRRDSQGDGKFRKQWPNSVKHRRGQIAPGTIPRSLVT